MASIMFLLAPAKLAAQRTAAPALAWQYMEIGAAVASQWIVASPEPGHRSLGWSLRGAFVSSSSPWGMELSVDFGQRRWAADGHRAELAIPVSVVRRVTRGGGQNGTDGIYLTAGLNHILVNRTESRPGGLARGITTSIGHRSSLGIIGAIRTDLVFARDNGLRRANEHLPGVTRIGIRASFGLYDPSRW